MSKIIGVIPARGGSVGVPLKNIKNLNGEPLISYTIKSAIESKCLDRVIVSTDHEETASISKKYGAEVPFKRPAEISEDVDTELVLQHVVNFLENEENYTPDAIVLLQPTQPFRTAKTLRACVELYKKTADADSVVSVNNIEGNRPEWMLSINEEGKVIPYNTPFVEDGKPVIKLVARQSLPNLFKQNGAVFVTSRDLLMSKSLVIGPNAYTVITDEREAVDIDTPVDFMIAEALMKN
jgi:N-acylneuraminate cytidylyltransferase/CMP-N,N'-diacetyllegionaminic acid synthase